MGIFNEERLDGWIEHTKAALPNITGELHYGHNGMLGRGGSATGCFEKMSCNQSDAGSGKEGSFDIKMDASLASDIFGKLNTIQPESCYALIIIKA